MTDPTKLSTVLADEFTAIIGARRASAEPPAESPQPVADQDPLETMQAALAKLEAEQPVSVCTVAQYEQARLRAAYAAAHRLNLSALCFSGGGIRSASFGLGIIQALAEAKLLRRFEYLSTVSGGGYIGSWLSAWIARSASKTTTQEILDALKPERTDPDDEPQAIRHLREYSSYLTPQLGLLSADTGAAVAIVIRNLVLNWLILVPAIFLPVIFVKAIGAFAHTAVLFQRDRGATDFDPWTLAGVVVAFVWIAFTAAGLRYKLGNLYSEHLDSNVHDAQRAFLSGSVFPSIVAGACFAWLANQQITPVEAFYEPFARDSDALGSRCGLVGMLVLALITYGIAALWTWWRSGEPPKWEAKDFASWGVAALASGFMVWFGVRIFTGLPEQLHLFDASCREPVARCVLDAACRIVTAHCDGSASGHAPILIDRQILLVVFAMPWFLLSLLTGQIVYVLLRSYAPNGDFEREWLGRAGGWNVIVALGWIVLVALVLFAPILNGAKAEVASAVHGWLAAVGGVSGVVTALLGKSSATAAKGPTTGLPGIAANVGLAISGPVFAAAVVMLLSLIFDDLALDHAFQASMLFIGAAASEPGYWDDWWHGGCVLLGSVVVMFTATYFVNVNRFSLHALYRNRLVRAYLGASHTNRKPDGFAGFDFDDNLHMAELWKPGRGWQPFHVINMALNLAATRNLAWQQRKAESFTVTPRFCGSSQLGYRETLGYGDPHDSASGGLDHGISLGTAMAISGAAVSPNMGYHSSPSIAFLLTMLNVRLGWWLGNPGAAGAEQVDWKGLKAAAKLVSPGRSLDPYRQDGPIFALRPLLAELFGLTNEDSPYVYLSDGGHFENLGLYEMVRRRCRWIVVSDAGQDGGRGFEDLGNAVRKIWIDLGVRITFDDCDLLASDAKTKPADMPYFAVGRIEYLSDGSGANKGRILYLKPAVRGTESAADVIAYARAHADFPNQSTADQWFDEPELESYRALGYLVVNTILKRAETIDRNATNGFEPLFDALDLIDPKTIKQKPAAG